MVIFAVANCTAGEVFIGVSSASGAVLLTGMRRLLDVRPSLIFIRFFVGFGLSYAIFSEWLNVPVRKSWANFSLMPVIPPLDTGLLPILQRIVVPMLGWTVAFNMGLVDCLLAYPRLDAGLTQINASRLRLQ